MSKSMTPMTELFPPSAELWKPSADQRKGVEFLTSRFAGALFADPGCGKTSVSLKSTLVLRKIKAVTKTLIIAPRRPMRLVWPAELKKWTDFHGLTYEILHGPDKDAALARPADLYLINPEGLDWLLHSEKSSTPTGKRRVRVDTARFRRLGFDHLIVDELSKFKHPQSLRFKALKEVLHLFRYRWGLTGSPAANGLMDLFGECYILDQGKALGQFITGYRREFFDSAWDGFSWAPKAGAEEKIYARLENLAIRQVARDLPPVMDHQIYIELPEAAKRHYKEIEDEFFTELQDGVVTAVNAAAKSSKLRQAAGGAVYLTEEGEYRAHGEKKWSILHEEKMAALVDLVDELQGQPLFVCYEFEHELTRLRKEFDKDLPALGGGVTDREADRIVSEWNLGHIKILAVQPQSAALGLNLQGFSAWHVAWYTLTWNYELYDQMIRRLRRQGSKANRIMNYQLLTRGTIDMMMPAVLTKKEKGQNSLFAALLAMRKSR